jgi:G6PDH family F420-dependent oxidoreductase
LVAIGYTMMCEQRGPKELVTDVQLAERADFDFAVISDHFHPWHTAQGHSPYAWSVLGAAAQTTERIGLMTYVTCPIVRYHPAVVAQKAATVALLSDGRFRLGLGAGENLNEHIAGRGWPPARVRHEMLGEAVEIIRALWEGGYVNYQGEHFTVEAAKIWDLPDEEIPLGLAVSGRESATMAGELADLVIATEPKAELVGMFAEAGGSGKPAVAQLPVCWGPDEAAARAKAREQFAWAAGGWKVQAELPNPVNFEAYSQFVREEDIAELVPCGPDPSAIAAGVEQFAKAGFTEVALVQIGDGPETATQAEFCDFYARELGPLLRAI